MSSATGIARSLTRRITVKKPDFENGPLSPNAIGRTFSMRRPSKVTTFDRNQISLPVELISATNPLAFDAPDIDHVHRTNASHHAHQSPAVTSPVEPSSRSFSSSSSIHTSDSVPALSSTDSSESLRSPHSTPVTPGVHDVDAFNPHLSALPEAEEQSQGSDMTPDVPTRAPSHTKRTHQAIARQRSVSRVRSPSASNPTGGPRQSYLHRSASNSSLSGQQSVSSTRSTTTSSSSTAAKQQYMHSSADAFSARPVMADTGSHPFGVELTELSEVAEEFAGTSRGENIDIPAPLASVHKNASVINSIQHGVKRSNTTSKTANIKIAPLAGPTPVASAAPRSSSNSVSKPVTVPMTKSASAIVTKTGGRKETSNPPTIWDEETQYLMSNGLHRFAADDYMVEIGALGGWNPYQEDGGWL